jgi:hypothetical protein
VNPKSSFKDCLKESFVSKILFEKHLNLFSDIYFDLFLKQDKAKFLKLIFFSSKDIVK